MRTTPTTIPIRGHYGSHTITAMKRTPTVYRLDMRENLCARYGYPEGVADDSAGFAFIDPSGGPFITVGAIAREYHPKLPDRTITRLEAKDGEILMHLTPKKYLKKDLASSILNP